MTDVASQLVPSESRVHDGRSTWNFTTTIVWPIRVISVVILMATLGSCSPHDTPAQISSAIQNGRSTEVCKSLLELIDSNEVVLLADNAHGQWQPRQQLMDLLDFWFRTASMAQAKPAVHRNLVLVLELDSIRLANALRYGTSKAPKDILDISLICSGTFTTADMEFFSRLGDLRQTIDAYNLSYGKENLIRLAVVPGESYIDVQHWSFNQRADYFLHGRDLDIAKRVASAATLDWDPRILVFYGAAHLQRGLVEKQADGKTIQGKYLVSYLDSLLGNSVITVGQVTADYWGPRHDLFIFHDGENFLSSKGLKAELRQDIAGPMGYDAVVVHRETSLFGTPILQVPSVNLARIIIRELPSILNTANDYSRSYWPLALTYLDAVSGLSPHRLDLDDARSLQQEKEGWDVWFGGAHDDLVSKISSLRLWKLLIDSLASSQGARARQFEEMALSLLENAPPLVKREGRWPSPSTRANELREYLQSDSSNLVIDNLIGLLWIGDESERREANDALRRVTGASMAGAQQWSDWRRRSRLLVGSQEVVPE